MQSLYLVCKIHATNSLKYSTPLEGVKPVVNIPMLTLKTKFVNLTSVMPYLKSSVLMVNALLVENILMLTKKVRPASQIHAKKITS